MNTDLRVTDYISPLVSLHPTAKESFLNAVISVDPDLFRVVNPSIGPIGPGPLLGGGGLPTTGLR